MKKLILKSGVGQHKNQHYEATHGEVDMRRWLYNQLIAFHLNPSDDCCETYVPPVGVADTDTRLTNPHVVGPNMVFDLLNVTNSTTTPNFISIPLSSLNINTTLVDNGDGTATYTNEAGVATIITLGLPETSITVTDSNTVDFTASGTANHTLTADVKLNNTGNVTLTSTATGIKADVVIPAETQTTLDSATLTIGNLLKIQYTGEDGLPQTVSVDLTALAIDINVASISYNPLNGEITLTETDSTVHTIDIGPFAETITSLVDNTDGSFTYTNEAGTPITWTETNTTITDTVTGHKVADYTSEDGTVTTINETVTTLNDFTLVGNVLGISYEDETGATISQDIDLTSILPIETLTTLDAPTLAGNVLSIKYTGEDTVQQVQTIDLSTLNTVQTQLTANDSNTIDLTTSGTDNHTITADVKLDNTGNVNFTTSASGIKGNVTFPTVVSSLNGATGNVTNSLTLGSAGTTPSITGSGTNNITLDLPTANTVNKGVLSNTDYTSFLDKVGLADNGLSLVGSGLTNKVQLGGNLIKNTTITNNGFNLDIVGTVPSRFSANGQVSIGTLTPTTDYALTINSLVNGINVLNTNSNYALKVPFSSYIAWTSGGQMNSNASSITFSNNAFNIKFHISLGTNPSNPHIAYNSMVVGGVNGNLYTNSTLGVWQPATTPNSQSGFRVVNTAVTANKYYISQYVLNNGDMNIDNGYMNTTNTDVANSTKMTMTYAGNLGIGTTTPSEKLHVVGNILATGTITPSDIRIKENINDFKGGLNKIVALEPKTYQIKKDSQMGVDSTILKAGFIAQDIEAIFGKNSIMEFNHNFGTIKEVTETEYESYSDVDYFKEIVNRDIYTTELVYDKNNEPVYEDEVQKTEQVFSHTETVYQIKGIKNVKAPKQEFIICSLVNAIKELNQQIIDLKAANNLI